MFMILWLILLLLLFLNHFTADGTFDSGQGSTVYSDSQSSQQSVIYSSMPDAIPPAIQRVYSPPLSESQNLPHVLQHLGPYQQPSVVSTMFIIFWTLIYDSEINNPLIMECMY